CSCPWSSRMVEVAAGEAEIDADQDDLHVGGMGVGGRHRLGGIGRVDQYLGVTAGFDVGHAVGGQGEVAAADDVALELRHAAAGIDAGDIGEVDLVGAVGEIGDRVGRRRRGVRRRDVDEGHLAGAGGQIVGSAAANNDVIATAARERVR